jgi:hypothetical protein
VDKKNQVQVVAFFTQDGSKNILMFFQDQEVARRNNNRKQRIRRT